MKYFLSPQNLFWQRILVIAVFPLTFFWFYHEVYQKVVGGKSIVIEDAKTANIVNIRNFGAGKVTRLRMYVSGELKGKAVLYLSHDKENRLSYPIGPGKVRLPLETGWQEPKCMLEYQPEKVTDGYLHIRYQFSTKK